MYVSAASGRTASSTHVVMLYMITFIATSPTHMYGSVPTFSCLVWTSVLPMLCLRRAKPECTE